MTNKSVSGKQSQQKAFTTAARELGCDESEEHFNAALGAIAKHKPPPNKPPAAKVAKKDKPAS